MKHCEVTLVLPLLTANRTGSGPGGFPDTPDPPSCCYQIGVHMHPRSDCHRPLVSSAGEGTARVSFIACVHEIWHSVILMVSLILPTFLSVSVLIFK